MSNEKRMILPTAVTPVIDGVLTKEEWGEPDFRLNAQITGGERTYCRDYLFGRGASISDMEFHLRYDEKYVYVAIRIADPAHIAEKTQGYQGVSRALTVSLGGGFCNAVPENGKLTTVQGNMCVAYTEKDGVSFFELAVPRDQAVKAGENGFAGFVEYSLHVRYLRPGETVPSASQILTRTTPIFRDENRLKDEFYFADGTPAPAPTLTVTRSDAADSPLCFPMKNGYTLHLDKPYVLVQGDVDDRIWGHYQFPGIHRLTDGAIHAGWCYNRDSIDYKSDVNPDGATYSVSYDNGETWTLGGKETGGSAKCPMPNGRYFTGFTGKGAYKTDYLDKYTPAAAWNGHKMYFADEIAETVDTAVTATEYDPATGETTRFPVTVHWPYMPLVLCPGSMVYPVTQIFSLSSRSVISVDGVLYYPLYFHGFDSFADSREAAADEWCRYSGVYVFKSADSGRTWDLLSQIRIDVSIKNPAEGFDEPEMTVLPDGSFFMLIRTGSGNPSYCVRSTDHCITWTKPAIFDSIGVMPQICTLGCGVTVASYGRPTMRFAATASPDGAAWDHYDIPVSGGAGQSCFYTDLLAVDDRTALLIYTDFMFPNKNGVPVKTVLVRKITVDIPE